MYVSSKNPVGTVRYLAPEYLKTELFNEYLNLTRADIYSSALVFWELLNRTKVSFCSTQAKTSFQNSQFIFKGILWCTQGCA